MSAHDDDRDLYEDPGLYWNPAPKPTPSVASGVTPAVELAEAAIYSTIWGGPRDDDRRPDEEEYGGARAVLAAALDVDALSNIIRKVDGNHELGAGALAEAIRAEILGES